MSRDELEFILAKANAAPSAGDLQAYEVVAVLSPRLRNELADAALGQAHVAEAPLVLVFCADPERARAKYGQRGVDLYAIQDATIACAYAQLAATELGLGSCWVGAFHEEVVAHDLHVPPTHRPVALLTVGRAAERPPATPRRSVEDLVRIDTFETPLG